MMGRRPTIRHVYRLTGGHMFDDIHDARELIGVAIGAGSVCWENPGGAGVFDSTRASEVADAAYQRLQTLLAGQFADREVIGNQQGKP